MDRIFLHAVLLLSTTLCGASQPNSENTGNQLPPSGYRVTAPIDLTHALDIHSPEWPGSASFAVQKAEESNHRGYFYATRDIALGEHVGTHMDAPYHFSKTGNKIGNISVSQLIASAVVVDGKSERNATIGLKDFDDWLLKYGPLPSPCVILFRFNWSRHYWQRADYFAMNGTNMEFPGITADLARHIASLNNVVGVGIDTPSIDPGKETRFLAHQELAAGNKFNLENLALSMALPPKDWTIIALPTKLTNGTGAPCRVIALPSTCFNAAPTGARAAVFVIAFPILGRLLVT